MNGLITKIEQAFTANGAEYKKVTVLDRNSKTTTKNVFDNLKDKWDLLEENKFREFVMEKKGQFWNVIDVKEAELPPPKLPTEQGESDEMSKEDWAEKDRCTRKSIERQKALSCATDIAVAKIQAGKEAQSTTTILSIAHLFESYIENGVVVKDKE